MSDYAWECMTTILSAKLLKHLQQLPRLQIEFATDPWLIFLFANLKFFSEKCLEFLHFWFTNFILSEYYLSNNISEKKICMIKFLVG